MIMILIFFGLWEFYFSIYGIGKKKKGVSGICDLCEVELLVRLRRCKSNLKISVIK